MLSLNRGIMRDACGPETVLGKAGVRHLVTTGQLVFINQNDNEAKITQTRVLFLFLWLCICDLTAVKYICYRSTVTLFSLTSHAPTVIFLYACSLP